VKERNRLYANGKTFQAISRRSVGQMKSLRIVLSLNPWRLGFGLALATAVLAPVVLSATVMGRSS
jgi:hypothetical protein